MAGTRQGLINPVNDVATVHRDHNRIEKNAVLVYNAGNYGHYIAQLRLIA
jgi:hypothetical protein